MKLILTLFFLATILIGCSSADAEFNSMSSTEAYELISSDSDVIVLDVRSEAEFLTGHIEGSILLPIDEIEDLANDVLLNQDSTILVLCQSGNRSRIASQTLANLGFKNVYDIGGIINWPGEIVD